MNKKDLDKITAIAKRKRKTMHGKTAYQILDMPECPISLPYARSMTTARIDYESREDSILEWYDRYVKNKKSIQFGVFI